MQKKKQHKPIKQIIIFIIAVILLLLIIFAEDIVKLNNGNKTALLENTPNETIVVEPNIPVLSAGMIPVKWESNHFVITTPNDPNWYDYRNGKPAYIMLNDGYYQSELLRDMTNKELAENSVGVGVHDDPQTQGTILMWIPRFAYNENGDIKYLKGIESADENWTIPDMFTYEQEAEVAPDFLLTGIWLEKDIDTNYANKITQMNNENSIYGFIKNTIAVSSNQTTQNKIQNYIAHITNGTTMASFPTDSTTNINTLTITDPTNHNRIIIKIINQNNQDPIKAKASYNKDIELITVEVTYSQYGIEKILYEDTQELKLTKDNNKAIATSEGLNIKYGTAKITIVDNQGNTKELELAITSKVYATLYSDGTLAFSKVQDPLPEKGAPTAKYSDISESHYEPYTTPWNSKSRTIATVEIVDEIAPKSTACWFTDFRKLTEIKNMNNLNTSNVTNMKWMFSQCEGITNLDVSNFDTSKVTNMEAMFSYCQGLTSLDVSNFDTRNIANMEVMFYNCSSLTSLNVSNFDTRNVANMVRMFGWCEKLTNLDISNFDTGNVTNMNGMFVECKNLTNINLDKLDTNKIIDMSNMFYGCNSLVTLDLSSLDTSNVTDVTDIFNNCSNLTQITFGEKWNKSVTLPTPTKEGYICTGWYSDSSFTNRVARVGENYTPKGTITIYASLLPRTYATLYSDGTLAFGRTENPLPDKTIRRKFGEVPAEGYTSAADAPWYGNSDIKTVNFVEEIYLNSAFALFNMCQNLTKVENIDNLKGVTNMSYMFTSCYELAEIDTSNLDTSNVTDMSYMFSNCRKLTKLDVSNFDTSNVTKMTEMFYYCESLTELDVSNFDTSNVTNMMWMFSSCSGLTELNVSNFNTSKVTNTAYMFSNCRGLTELNVDNFNTSNVTNMMRMFNSCNGLKELDISNFDTRSATNMNNMFSYSRNLKTIYVGENWTTDNATTTEMFYNCGTNTVTRK